jgi:hypothetical protein
MTRPTNTSFFLKMLERYGLLLLGCLFFCFSGCTETLTRLVPPHLHEPNGEFVVIRDYDTTWNALIRALDEKMGLQVTRKDKNTGTIVLAPVSVDTRAFCDCGKIGEVPIQGKGVRKTVIRIHEQAPRESLMVVSTKYSTVYHWKNVEGNAVRKETIPCVSNGKYELEIYAGVISYLGP